MHCFLKGSLHSPHSHAISLFEGFGTMFVSDDIVFVFVRCVDADAYEDGFVPSIIKSGNM
ncbi:hypothetical protein Hanom_Chr04g00312181 [Helianthus anomalus]